jgi:hypothetical protein
VIMKLTVLSLRLGRHSGIPSLNVCMNCHKNIAEVAETTATLNTVKRSTMSKKIV